jgi:hypothetical protein
MQDAYGVETLPLAEAEWRVLAVVDGDGPEKARPEAHLVERCALALAGKSVDRAPVVRRL